MLTGCAGIYRVPGPNPLLQEPALERLGDTAVYRGTWKNGQPRSEIRLVRGKAHGTLTIRREDGGPESTAEFVDGKKHGQSVWYWPGGANKQIRRHISDTVHLESMVDFDSTGSQISAWVPMGGPATGAYLLRRNGKVYDSTFYRNGKEEGLAFHVDTKGDTVSRAFFVAGKEDTIGFKPRRPSGQRSTESILKVIRRYTPELRHTYNAHLRRSRFNGKVTLTYAIAPSGLVTWIHPVAETAGRPHFARDVVAKVQRWRYESVDSRADDVVTVPFTFSE